MKVFIDKKEIEFEGKKTILEAARENGVFIPSLCDHSRLAPFTGCRLCIVKVKGRRGFPPSCATYMEEGMEVRTDTADLRKLRKQILELILSEHPNACLVCTEKKSCDEYKSTIRKVGEVTGCVLCTNNNRCELQNTVEALKIDSVRYPSLYRGFDLKKEDPFFDRNYNLCILCGRCARICHEVRGASAISFVYRGSKAVISTALDLPLFQSGCQFCGACVDACPTGSLTERAIRYDPLPDAKTATICPLCSIGCRVDVELNKGRILYTRAAQDSPVNKGQICVKGRFGIRDAISSPQRILRPLIRKKKELEEATWDEALQFAAENLKKFKKGEVAFVASPQVPLEDLYVFHRFSEVAFRTRPVIDFQIEEPPRENQNFQAEGICSDSGNFLIEDISNAKVIFLFGSGLGVSHPIIWLEVLKAVKNGSKLVILDSDESFITRFATLWLRIQPGSEFSALCALSKIGLESMNEKKMISVERFASFKESLLASSLSSLSSLCGISEEELKKTVEILLKNKPAAFLRTKGSSSLSQESNTLAALWNFSLLFRGALVPLASEINTEGLSAIQSHFSRKDGKSLQAAMSALKGSARALYLAGPFPVHEKDKVDFLVVQDSFMSGNAKMADAVFPALTFVEREGTFVNVESRAQLAPQIIEPMGEAKPDWWILVQLARKMGYNDFLYKKSSEVMDEMHRKVPGFSRITSRNLKSGKDVFIGRRNGAERKFLPFKEGAVPEERSRKFPFMLFLEPDRESYRSFNLSEGIKGFQLIRNHRWVNLCSLDAEDLGLKPGDSALVETPYGTLERIVRVSDFTPRGSFQAKLLWNEDSLWLRKALDAVLVQPVPSLRWIPARIKRGK